MRRPHVHVLTSATGARPCHRRCACRPALVALLVLAVAHGTIACGCQGNEGQRDDEVVVVLDAAPRTFDPRFATSDQDVKVVRMLFAGLVTTETDDGIVELDLAASIEERSPTHYVVTLRDDASFHDGTPVRSHDVVFTYETLGDENVRSPFAAGYRSTRFVATDPLTVEIMLEAPEPAFAYTLELGIVPAHLLGESGTFGDQAPIGAGPYAWSSTDRRGGVTLRAHEGYHGGTPSITWLTFRPIPDVTTRMLAILSGAVDVAQNAVPPLMLPVIERYDDLVIERSASFKYSYLMFNLEVAPLSDLRVRQAFAHAIDREEIITYKFSGAATLSTGLLPPGHWAYSDAVETYAFDPDRARTLLDEAGLTPAATDGCRMRLTYKTSSNAFYKSVAEVIAAQLGEVGVCVDVVALEWGTFFGDVRAGNFELASLQWPSVIEPRLYAWIHHSSNIPSAENRDAGGNRGRCRSDELDRRIDFAQTVVDQDDAREAWAEVQAEAARELCYVSLWHEDNIVVRTRALENYRAVPNARFRRISEARLNRD